jgi:hypothetical protein
VKVGRRIVEFLQLCSAAAFGAALVTVMLAPQPAAGMLLGVAAVAFCVVSVGAWVFLDAPSREASGGEEFLVTESRLKLMEASGVPADICRAMRAHLGERMSAETLQKILHERFSEEQLARYEEAVLLHSYLPRVARRSEETTRLEVRR